MSGGRTFMGGGAAVPTDLGLTTLSLADDPCERWEQLCDLELRDIPDEIEVHGEVVVHDLVSHPDDR